MSYQIITDSCCDFSPETYRELNVEFAKLSMLYKGENYTDFTEQWLSELYAAMKEGAPVSTTAVNPQGWHDAMVPSLQAGQDVLVLAFSSGLSTTYQSAEIAAQELRETYPQRKILVVDTLCASLGQGLLVWYACQKRDAGMGIEELAQWCAETRGSLCHWFTVDDLMFLKKGGRINAATALLGTMLQIKPVLHMDDSGKLVNVAKARGRKAAIEALAKKLGETGLPGTNDTVFICYADCRPDAQYLSDLVKEKYGVQETYIHHIGGVIGSHAGPGTLAIFFLGSQR